MAFWHPKPSEWSSNSFSLVLLFQWGVGPFSMLSTYAVISVEPQCTVGKLKKPLVLNVNIMPGKIAA